MEGSRAEKDRKSKRRQKDGKREKQSEGMLTEVVGWRERELKDRFGFF